MRLLSVKQASEKLAVSVRKVWAMYSTGQMPAPVRMGRSVRWRESDLNEWVRLGCPAREEFETRRKGPDDA